MQYLILRQERIDRKYKEMGISLVHIDKLLWITIDKTLVPEELVKI